MRVILLEHPREASPAHFNDIANTPLWSCLMTGYAGSVLQHAGHAVQIVDAACWSAANTVHYLLDHPADLLGIHAVYSWEKTPALFELLADLRRSGYDASISLYGFFPTLVWNDILNHCPAVDQVVVGEPEAALADLAANLEIGSTSHVPGVAARVAGTPTLKATRSPLGALDDLPFPLRPALESEATVSILASRGCSNRCSFCLIPTLTGARSPWRGRSVSNIMAEITGLMARGKRDFYFVDPNFVGPGKKGHARTMDLAAGLADCGISFGMETRAGDITPALMKALARAGLSSLLLGIESGSARVLQRLAKHASTAWNEQAIAAVRAAGLEPEIGFIMFDAASTLDDLAQNLDFLRRNNLLQRLGRTANLLHHDHIAFKGTAGYQAALQGGMLVPQGLFGFEGRLLYQDPRVGWLAELMKRICRFLLREMGLPHSPIHWLNEDETREPYRGVNDQLVEIFERLLQMAATFNHPPEQTRTERLFANLRCELQTTLSRNTHRQEGRPTSQRGART